MARDSFVGRRLGRYLIREQIGQGGMSRVYRAEHEVLGTHLAVKVLSDDLSSDQQFRQRFLDEARLAARLSIQHQNIARIYDADEEEGTLYIAMDFVMEGDLRRLIEQGPIEPEQALRILSQVAAALDFAHRNGLVHRDVKPANVLVASGDRAFLSDFGIAKDLSDQVGLTRTGMFVGTVDYAAPEQISGKEVDGRTDVYALGCMLYECLVGSPPFARELEVQTIGAHLYEPPPRVTAARPELPAALDGVVERALAKTREERFGSCQELIEAARSALGLDAGHVEVPHAAATIQAQTLASHTLASPESPFRIFINYRRSDSAGYAGRLWDALADRFGAERVFIDIDTIRPGVDFAEVINEAVDASDVVIAVIGKGWLTAADSKGRRRLDDPDDFVRMELATALERNVRVIPALVGGTEMPLSDELPDSLKKLARRNALDLSDARWRYDMDRLIRTLDEIARERSEKARLEREQAERAAAEQAAADQAAAAQQAALLERERAEQDRVEHEALDRERQELETQEREAAERAEVESLARERVEREAAARAQAERVERERADREKAERGRKEREAAERAEAERLKRQREEERRVERERRRQGREEAERAKAEAKAQKRGGGTLAAHAHEAQAEAGAVAVERPARIAPSRPLVWRGAAIVLLAAAAAAAGFLVGDGTSSAKNPPPTPPAGQRGTPFATASAGDVSLRYPKTWRPIKAGPGVPGIDFTNPIELAPAGRELAAGLQAGAVAAEPPSFLPAPLRAIVTIPQLRERAVVRLGAFEAFRYRTLRPAGFGKVLTLYVVPASNVTTVACFARPDVAAKFLRECEGIAVSLAIKGTEPYSLTPSRRYAAALGSIGRKLRSERDRGVRRMASARTQRAQAQAARSIVNAYSGSARRIRRAPAAPLVAQENTAIANALGRTARAYSELAVAAQRGNRSRYEAARRAVAGGEAALRAAIARLAPFGYVVG